MQAVQNALKFLAPPPKLTISEWADTYRYLPKESTAEYGKWSTARVPYAREPMDMLSSPDVDTVVLQWASQTGKTEVLLNILGYYIHQDPSPILKIDPILKMAENFSKTRLKPTIEVTPVLRDLIPTNRQQGDGNTILNKNFPGGYLAIVASNSAADLASRPIRIILADEVDRYGLSADGEGDPLQLAKQRQNTFANAKTVITSTPTIKGYSVIENWHESADQRRFFVPCCHCGTWDYLRFEYLRVNRELEKTYYECPHCHNSISTAQKNAMVTQGRWQPISVPKQGYEKVRSYHLWAIYSPWISLAKLAEAYWQSVANKEMEQVFANTVLANTYENTVADTLNADALQSRAETYRMLQVPEGAKLLTAGVDVQGDRLVLTVYGWGVRQQAWLVYYQELWGKPTEPDCWQQLKEILDSTYDHASGVQLRIYRCAIDSGAYTNEVYQFVRAYRSPWASAHKTVIAVKGSSKSDAPICGKPSKLDVNYQGRTIKQGITLYAVGDNSTKTTIYGRLSLETNSNDAVGWFHFPQDAPERYYEQLLGERKVVIFNRGMPKETWQKKLGNSADALDATRYAMAALYSINAHLPAWDWDKALAMSVVSKAVL